MFALPLPLPEPLDFKLEELACNVSSRECVVSTSVAPNKEPWGPFELALGLFTSGSSGVDVPLMESLSGDEVVDVAREALGELESVSALTRMRSECSNTS